jgi:hypothetical protein
VCGGARRYWRRGGFRGKVEAARRRWGYIEVAQAAGGGSRWLEPLPDGKWPRR